MSKSRGENKSPANNQTASEVSRHDNIESELLTTLGQINPKKLESISHSKYISRLSKTLTYCLDHDYSKLLLFVQAIKDCGKPCYKRDALIETLHNTFFVQQVETVLLRILCDISRDNRDFMPWKEMANVIVTLPDLIANCGLIDRYLEFVPKSFYCILLEIIHKSLLSFVDNNKDSTLREEVALFYAHLIGRVAIAGFRTLVWNKLTSRLVPDDSAPLRSLVSSILGVLIRNADFEIFIESLYGPIFYHMRPTPTNGEIIESIIGDSLLHNETLQYIVCKKYILQTNFNQDRHRQNLILYNIFSYLSRLASNNKSTMAAAATTSTRETSSSVYDGDRLDTETEQGSTILINTLLEVAKSWSNGTKILLRPYDHNRYIGCAMVMALKFMMRKEHQQSLLKRADEIQTEVIRGLQIYLNRSSSDVRNIAMCVAEILLTRLHDLIDAEVGKDLAKKRVPLELNVEWDESCLAIKSMFQLDIVTFCKELDSNIDSHDETRVDITVPRMNRQQSQHRHESATAPVEQAVSDDASDKDDDHDIEHDDESMDAPIYLNDCISGLIDNNKPRYVKLCLSKVVELIRQLSKQREENDQKQGKVKNDNLKKSTTNDAIRDVAIELAQVLLYLEDQYSLDDFDALQRSALVSLTVAAPDLVAKYLLDELNNQSKNIRHQTIILQTLIESAQRLGNRFTKYGALYFYGMVHQLKISTLAPSSISIVSAVKSLKADQLVTSDDSYLLSRVLLSVSLIIKCLNQQLITCKLSNDLLDILAAYRHHPDSGVRKAIVTCLTVIRDCTPAVYFREHLNDRTAQLFGAWLAIESEFIREDSADKHARSTHLT